MALDFDGNSDGTGMPFCHEGIVLVVEDRFPIRISRRSKYIAGWSEIRFLSKRGGTGTQLPI